MAHASPRSEELNTQLKCRLERISATPLTLPLDKPHSDGTLVWSSVSMVVVECSAGGATGIGYTYAQPATAKVIEDLLASHVRGVSAMATADAHYRMLRAVRNQGREGIAAAAISAVDSALWDLKARLLGVPLACLLGLARESVLAYASGGFTSSNLDELQREFAGYREQGFRHMKLKVGRHPEHDEARVRAVREAVGEEVLLMVDGNGAYQPTQAAHMAERFARYGVVWFEEPTSSDDLPGLALLRERLPPGMQVAAGEYGYTSTYFERMLSAGAVDVLQADATRCAGVSGFMRADALCTAHNRPLSAHCAPSLHATLGAAAGDFRHVEYFHDHAPFEQRIFDPVPELADGHLKPHLDKPGFGWSLRRDEMKRLAA